jgi:hypothetical protein
MLLLIVTTAFGGKLKGWESHLWGSAEGGPGDPAAAAWYPKSFGEAAYLVCNRPSTDTKFGDMDILNPFVFYVEGKLAGSSFLMKDQRLVEALSSLDPSPLHAAMSSTLLQVEDVSLLVQPSGDSWLVQLVYVPLKKRCVELLGPACTMAETKAEAEADPHWHAPAP